MGKFGATMLTPSGLSGIPLYQGVLTRKIVKSEADMRVNLQARAAGSRASEHELKANQDHQPRV